MKLYYNKKAADPVYYGQVGYRIGSKTTTKNVRRFGKHSELLAITSDPLAYVKAEIDKYNEELKSRNTVSTDFKIDFAEKIIYQDDLVSHSNCLNTGYFVLQRIYRDLKIPSFFKKITDNSKITYDPDLVLRFLTFARILSPGSKLDTYDHLKNYYGNPCFDYSHILRTMDILEQHYDEYLAYLFKHSNSLIKRNTSVCYFDCTNFYFEKETEDEDYTDPVTGEVIRGLCKYGPSKEHRPNLIVEMGLFMDSDGIPLSMCINSGSENEQKCAVPAEKQLVKMFEGKKFIYCADAGLSSFNIRQYNSMGGRCFVVTQSVKKLSAVLQKAVFNDYDYRLLSNNKPVSVEDMKEFDRTEDRNLALYNDKAYKVLYADKAMDIGLTEEKLCRNGKVLRVKSKANLKQKVIVTFSRKMMEYQRYIRNKQIERAMNIVSSMNPDAYKKGPNDVTRFIRRISVTKDGEKALDRYEIDLKKIKEEEKYDGYYAIATNLNDDAKTIVGINAGRYKIEDCFRVMKSNFSARPVYHRLRERIRAHFMICFTALLIFRILETKLRTVNKELTTQSIIDTLKNMCVVNMQDICYAAIYSNSQSLAAIEEIFGLNLNKKYYLPRELNKNLRKFSK